MERDSNKRYFKWGLTALVVIFISILLVVIFTNLPGFFALLTSIGKILSPLISGVVIAFLLNPLVNFVDCRLGPLLQKKLKVQTAKNLSRAAGIVMALIVAGFLVYGFFAMLLPQLYESVMNIVDNARHTSTASRPGPRTFWRTIRKFRAMWTRASSSCAASSKTG